MEFLTSISEYASIITVLLMFGTTFILTFKSIREWIATDLANKVNVSKLSRDGDIYKELKKTKDHAKNINDLNCTLVRLELLQMLYLSPHDKKSIYMLIEKYQKLGGNSYMCDIIDRWKKGEFKSTYDRVIEKLENNK